MRKIRRLLFCIILIALTVEGVFSSNLLSHKIATASLQELNAMATARGLSVSDDEVTLRNSLYEAEGITVDDKKVDEEVKGYTLEIINADTTTSRANGNFELAGNVEISFKNGSEEKILTCERLLFDTENKKITAFNNVVFTDKDKNKSKLGDVEADIVTFFYESENLIISGGTTETERTTSEDKKVTFYTSGELLSYRSEDGGLVFKDGFISSDIEDSYSSISASTLALLDGGDMFLKGATLKLGRVPLIYMPIFFYPGSTIVGNPAFGFQSNKGMFVSTTWELFGRNKELETETESSSFSALLKSSEEGTLVSNGIYYEVLEEGEQLTPFQSWADKSKSYFSISADVYQNAGLFLGYDASINTSSNLFKSESHSGIALSQKNYAYDGNLRFFSNSSFTLKSDWANLTLNLPYYSDPTVYRDYKNRLTSFSFDSFLGLAQEFPTTYNSTYTTYTVKASGELKLPSKYSSKYLNNFRLYDINMSVLNRWYERELEYYMEEIVLPSLKLSASGSIFEIGEKTVKTSSSTKDDKNITEKFILEDELLRPLYEKGLKRSVASNKGSYLNLGYTITSSFANEYEKDSYTDKEYEESLNSDNKLVLTMEGAVKDLFTLKEVVTPSFSYKNDNDESKSEDTTLLSSLKLASPFLGLEYNLNNRVYRKQITVNGDSLTEKTLDWFTFNKDSVTTHNISLKRDFKTDDIVITPKLSYTLPPLKVAITPSLSFSGFGFMASLSWAFAGEDYKSEDINLAVGFTGKNFLFSTKALYESEKFESSDFFKPLTLSFSTTLQTSDKKYSISESGKWVADGNVFSSLLTTLKIPTLTISLDYKTINNELKANYLSIEHKVTNALFTFWKNRIGLAFSFDNKFYYDFNNDYNSYLVFSPALIFKIQEFLDIKISYTMRNDAFYKYNTFNDIWNDLLASFDFVGNGRKITSFTMNSMALELTHYMQDWDLVLRYNADVVYENNFYQWVPSISIFLKWKTMPDLKVDENWKYTNSKWISTGPSEK